MMKRPELLIGVVILIIALFQIGCEKEKNNEDPVPDPVFPNCGTVSDIDGNLYNTVKIGDQCWMRQNLRTTHYRNGDPIATTETPTSSIVGDSLPKYQWVLEGNNEYLSTFGRVYSFYTTTDPRGVCPEGWHVPSDEEWQKLEISLGMTPEDAATEGLRGTGTGSKIAGNSSLWKHQKSLLLLSEEFGSSGFDGLPGGARNPGGYSVTPGSSTYWWTSTIGSSAYNTSSYARYINYESSSITRNRPIVQFGLYIRCLKDN